MSFPFQSILRRSLMTACAVLSLGVAQTSYASFVTPVAQVTKEAEQPCSITQDHVWFFTYAAPVEVTDTLYTYQGRTYAVYQNTSVLIVPDYEAGIVRDGAGNQIGFTVKECDSQSDTPYAP